MKELERELLNILIELGLISEKYYGKLILNIQAGNIINYGKEETIKLT